MLAEGLPDAAAVRELGDRILASLTGTVRLGDHLVAAGASVGVAVATPEDDARSVLREADAAMYRAKALGRGRLELGAAVAGHTAPDGHGSDQERRPA